MPVRVLVIDDDVEFANLIGLLLGRKGYEAKVVYSGAEGMEAAASFAPAVIVQDLMLPDISGTELLDGLKKTSPASKIIIITGKGDEEIAVDLMKAGASDYLKKPFESEKLFSTVNKVLNLKSAEQELEKLVKEVAHQNREFFALNAFSSALLSSQPVHEKYRPALEIVMNSMGGAAAVMNATNPDGRKIYISVSGDKEEPGLQSCGMARNVGLMSYVADIKKAAVVKDFREEKRFKVPEEILQRGIKSSIAVPLIIKNKVRGVLAVFSNECRDYNSSDIKLMSSFGNQLALSIDNDYMAYLLANFQNQWQVTLDAVPDIINIQDLDHTIIMANKAAAEWSGFNVREIIGQKCSWAFHNQKEPYKNCPVEEAIHTKSPVEKEMSIKDNRLIIHAYPVLGQDGEVAMVVERIEKV